MFNSFHQITGEHFLPRQVRVVKKKLTDFNKTFYQSIRKYDFYFRTSYCYIIHHYYGDRYSEHRLI